MRRILSFLAGGMCGALIGGVAALLLTPTSGPELQAKLQQEWDQLEDEFRDAYRTRRAELEAELEALHVPRKREKPGFQA